MMVSACRMEESPLAGCAGHKTYQTLISVNFLLT
jgi:hypothetical protein